MKKFTIVVSILLMCTEVFAQTTTNSEGARTDAAGFQAQLSLNTIELRIAKEKLKKAGVEAADEIRAQISDLKMD